MDKGQQSGEAGFTLVEVIVALAILAVSLSVLFGVISNTAWQTAQAEKLTHAGLLAQSLLARVGAEMPVRQGDAEGDYSNGFHWRLRTVPYGNVAERKESPVDAYTVSAEVSWNDGFSERSVVLTTLRLAPKDAAQ